ncbi:histidine phosphatase family protein [uncultured Flavonifractor sp.]|uniref:histidine phosphatase family protein n=1 Tax=uncultured Flavonifractor sp. TaxID=1193534 RepID=UPI00260BB6C7|nr:histidine phosphatase family protein [uncultured Flavonifractor sp.]
MELILIRHGTTQGNLEKRFVGVLDVPLAPQGEELARRVSPTLPRVEHIYRSPLLRCRQTAQLLWPDTEMTVIQGLRETDFGPFEGKNHQELKDDPLYQAWIGQGDRLNFAAMPVGETAQQVVERVSAALAELVKDAAAHGYERVGVVSHGGALMGLLSKYGRPEREYYDWMCPNCGGFRMALDPDTLELTVLEEYKG